MTNALKQVGGGGTVFYAARGFNALRQLLGVNFGNGVVTTNNYYPASNELDTPTKARGMPRE